MVVWARPRVVRCSVEEATLLLWVRQVLQNMLCPVGEVTLLLWVRQVLQVLQVMRCSVGEVRLRQVQMMQRKSRTVTIHMRPSSSVGQTRRLLLVSASDELARQRRERGVQIDVCDPIGYHTL